MITSGDEKARRHEVIGRHLSDGGSLTTAAEELGIRSNTLRMWWRDNSVDPAVQQGMTALGMDTAPAGGWIKSHTPDENGLTYSFMLPKADPVDDTAERIRAALEAVPAIPVIPAPEYADDDLLTVYPLADVHLGAMSWGKETGADYDLSIGADRVVSWVGRCVAASPPSGTAILLDVGDLSHANDQTNQTQKSKHQLDTDTRHFKTTQTAILTLAIAAETIAAHHLNVIIRILPGNHNPDAYLAILFALGQRYRDNPRITVQEVPGEFFAHRFGDVMIAAHHGDKAKAERLVFFLADEYAVMWGATRHRFLFTGHLHHHKSADIGGVQWEQLRAVTERDAYAVSHAFTARAQLQAITYHRTRGEVQRVKVGA